MRKKIINWSAKIAMVLLVTSLTMSTVILALALYDTNDTKNDLQDEFEQIEQSKNDLASDADQSQTSYQSTVDDLEDQIQSLKLQNEELESIALAGFGEITGEVAQIIFEEGDLGKNQLVCAQDTSNDSRLFCVSIPSVKKSYRLVVPSGTYSVFATPFSEDTVGTSNKAFYTAFVECLQSDSSNCDENDNSPVPVTVSEGEVLQNIDPIDLN